MRRWPSSHCTPSVSTTWPPDALAPAARGDAVVVMLSSSSDPADRDRAARHASVKGYLTKPLDRQMAAALPTLVGLAGRPGAPV